MSSSCCNPFNLPYNPRPHTTLPERRNQSYDDSLRELSDDVYNDAGKEERKVEKDFLKFIIISSNFHHQDIRYEEYDI